LSWYLAIYPRRNFKQSKSTNIHKCCSILCTSCFRLFFLSRSSQQFSFFFLYINYTGNQTSYSVLCKGQNKISRVLSKFSIEALITMQWWSCQDFWLSIINLFLCHRAINIQICIKLKFSFWFLGWLWLSPILVLFED